MAKRCDNLAQICLFLALFAEGSFFLWLCCGPGAAIGPQSDLVVTAIFGGFRVPVAYRNVTGETVCGPQRTGNPLTACEYCALIPVSPGQPFMLPVYSRVTPTPSTSMQAAVLRMARAASAGLNI